MKRSILPTTLALVLVSGFHPVAFAAFSFTPAPTVTLGNGGPSDVALGDFDGDGDTDIATTLVTTGQVRVFLGNGSGGFAAGNTYTVGAQPQSLIARDFNGDGKLDLAVCNFNSTFVTILIGAGGGNFVPFPNADLGANSHPRDVAGGDFNNDGFADLLVAGDGATFYLRGQGNGMFVSSFALVTGAQGVAAAPGHLNGDANLDFVTVNSSNFTVSPATGNGTGLFTPGASFASGQLPSDALLGDFDGDGKADLAISVFESGGSVRVASGNGDGTFDPLVAYPSGMGPNGLAAADLDGNGTLDVVTPNYFSATVSVLGGNGNGTLQAPAPFATGQQPIAIALGRIDADSKPDLVVPNNLDSTITVLLNTSTASPNDVLFRDGFE